MMTRMQILNVLVIFCWEKKELQNFSNWKQQACIIHCFCGPEIKEVVLLSLSQGFSEMTVSAAVISKLD